MIIWKWISSSRLKVPENWDRYLIWQFDCFRAVSQTVRIERCQKLYFNSKTINTWLCIDRAKMRLAEKCEFLISKQLKISWTTCVVFKKPRHQILLCYSANSFFVTFSRCVNICVIHCISFRKQNASNELDWFQNLIKSTFFDLYVSP